MKDTSVKDTPVKDRDERLRPYAWGLLGLLLATTLVGAFLHDRLGWNEPRLLPGEATALMQARSLSHDFDLVYEREDFDRLLLARGGEPPDLELASGSGGRRIGFDRPFPYALWLAPFVRLAPERGFAVAQAVLLAAVALFAAFTLRPLLGALAPAWVAVLLGASVTWSYVWLATGDLFLWAVVVVAFGLLARTRGGRLTAPPSPRSAPRAALAAGVLLAIPFATEPLYGVLAAAAFFVVPAKSGHRSLFLAGLAGALAVMVAVQWWASGGLHFVATTRFRFTPATGFPLVDFTAADWPETVRRFQALYWDEAPRFAWGVDPLLWAWDVVYLFAGRHIGLLPYYLPIVLLVAAGSFAGWRRPIAVAVGVWMVAIVVLHPFDLYGGAGAIANRLFLPVYGASWFLLARRPRIAWAALPLAAALFLWPSWTRPGSDPISPEGGYRYVTPVAERILPYETSQRWIPANELADHFGLRLLLRNDGVWSEARRERLVLDERRRARMVIASPEALPSLDLEFGPEAPSDLRVRGAELVEKILLADGGIAFRLRPSGARRHPLWWTPDRQWLYVVDFELPAGDDASSLAFQLFGSQ